MMTRRSFLTGSVLLAAVPVFAQSPAPKSPLPPTDSPKDEKKLIDKDGREYRICPQCGGNMYKQGKLWICEVCGYSYVE